jgi:hypothetical protein
MIGREKTSARQVVEIGPQQIAPGLSRAEVFVPPAPHPPSHNSSAGTRHD